MKLTLLEQLQSHNMNSITLTPAIRTPRLLLRAPQLQDAPGMAALFANPRSTEFEPHKPRNPTTEHYAAEIPKYEARRERGEAAMMSILRSSDDGTPDVVIGFGGINGISLREGTDRVADVGVLIDSSEWRKGYGREALAATFEYAYDEGQCQFVMMETMAVNKPLQALAASLGLDKHKQFVNDDQECLYMISKAQWEAARAG